MGLIKAGIGAVGGSLADQWKEFFYCDSLDKDVLMKKGEKRVSGRSSNKKGNDNIISNGSGIAVADGQCMIIVEQGKIVEVCAEPGEFTYDTSTEPSIFTGSLGNSIIQSFKIVGKRFTFGGDTGKDQRIYYFNTKEIIDNKFGTASPISFRVSDPELGIRKTVKIRCNGTYTYQITDPLLFYTKLCGNVENEYLREEIDSELKAEFIDALLPAFGELSKLRMYPGDIPYHTQELKKAMNETLKPEWAETRGITLCKIAMNPITLSPEDMEAISMMEDAASMGSNANMMAGRMVTASAKAMENAADNPNGAMAGFMGMGMAMNNMGGGGMMNAASDFYNKGEQQKAASQNQQHTEEEQWTCSCGAVNTGKFCMECGKKKPEPKKENTWTCSCGAVNTGKFCAECGKKKPEEQEGWTCSCGAVNKGKFCMECGKKKPEGAPLYRCDKCGWEPEDPMHPPKFCPECGDLFDDRDIQE